MEYFADRISPIVPEARGGKPLRVLLALDASPASQAALRQAVGLEWSAGSHLHVVEVVPDRRPLLSLEGGTGIPADIQAFLEQSDRRQAEARVAKGVHDLRAASAVASQAILHGRPSERILDFAERIAADLILMGALAFPTMETGFLSATAHKILTRASSSVWLVRPPGTSPPRNLILGVDGSAWAEKAADFLAAYLRSSQSRIRVVGVAEIDPDDLDHPAHHRGSWRSFCVDLAGANLGRMLARFPASQAQGELRCGRPDWGLIRAARSFPADLMVIGAQGLSQDGLYPLGSQALKVAKYAPCSVLLVR